MQKHNGIRMPQFSKDPREDVYRAELVDKVEEMMRILPPREFKVIFGLYFDQRPPVELAAELEMHVPNIYRTEKQALRRMAEYLAENNIELR